MTEFEVSESWSESLNLNLDEHSVFPRPFVYFDPKWFKKLDAQGYVRDGLNPEHMHFAHIAVGLTKVKIEDRDNAFGIVYSPTKKAFLKPNRETCNRLKLLVAVNGTSVLQNSSKCNDPHAKAILEALPRQQAIYERVDKILQEYDEVASEPLGEGLSPICPIWSLELDLAITKHLALGFSKPSLRKIDDIVWTDIANISVRLGYPDVQMGLQWCSGRFHREIYGRPDYKSFYRGVVAPVPSVMQRFERLIDGIRPD